MDCVMLMYCKTKNKGNVLFDTISKLHNTKDKKAKLLLCHAFCIYVLQSDKNEVLCHKKIFEKSVYCHLAQWVLEEAKNVTSGDATEGQFYDFCKSTILEFSNFAKNMKDFETVDKIRDFSRIVKL